MEWVSADLQLVHDLKISEHINTVTYLRLLMPWVLPPHVNRAIYADADMLVRRNLGDLWDEPQGDHAALAVQDVAAPWIDALHSLPNFERCKQHLCAWTPVVNYRELGVPQDAKYLNGGMLVVNVDAGAASNTPRKCLPASRTQRARAVVGPVRVKRRSGQQMRSLDLRWNQGAHIYVYPKSQSSPFDRETFQQLRREPWIIHFCSPSKPWHYFCRHPFARDWRRCLRRTDWHAWQPENPSNSSVGSGTITTDRFAANGSGTFVLSSNRCGPNSAKPHNACLEFLPLPPGEGRGEGERRRSAEPRLVAPLPASPCRK